MKSWKTTIAGIACITGAIVLLTVNTNKENAVTATTLIAIGAGLISSRDRDSSSENEGLK